MARDGQHDGYRRDTHTVTRWARQLHLEWHDNGTLDVSFWHSGEHVPDTFYALERVQAQALRDWLVSSCGDDREHDNGDARQLEMALRREPRFDEAAE